MNDEVTDFTKDWPEHHGWKIGRESLWWYAIKGDEAIRKATRPALMKELKRILSTYRR